MSQKDPDYTHKDSTCEPTGCCSTPSQGKSCCGWKGVIFVIVLLLAGAVLAHSLWTDQNGTIDEGLTSGSIGISGGEPVGSGYAEQEQQQAISASETEQTATIQVIPGTQEVCPVMGNPIKEDVFADYDGKRVYFCCPGCDGKFMEEPEKYIAQMEAEGVVLAKVVTNGNGETAMEGCACGGMEEQAAAAKEDCCGKCETILEKLTRIEQLLEQLLSSKTEGQTPDAPAPKAANVIK